MQLWWGDAHQGIVAKAVSAHVLHVVSSRSPVHVGILISSVSSFGSKGAEAYPAANAFLDSHAAACAARGLRKAALVLPAIREVGMAAMAFGGLLAAGASPLGDMALDPDQLCRFIANLLVQPTAGISILLPQSVDIVFQGFTQLLPKGAQLLSELIKPSDLHSLDNNGETLSQASPGGRSKIALESQVLEVVQLATGKQVRLDTPFLDAGIDSLSAMLLASKLSSVLGMAVAPSTIHNCPSARELAAKLHKESRPSMACSGGAGSTEVLRSGTRLRCLMLHGDAGDGDLLELTMQATGWLQPLADEVTFIFADAPHPCTPRPEIYRSLAAAGRYEKPQYCHWGLNDAVLLEQSLQSIKMRLKVLAKDGGALIIGGMCNGSIMAALLASQLHMPYVNFSGGPPSAIMHQSHAGALSSIMTPSLHFVGRADELFSQTELMELPGKCNAAVLVPHPLGHVIPPLSDVYIEQVRAFFHVASASKQMAVLGTLIGTDYTVGVADEEDADEGDTLLQRGSHHALLSSSVSSGVVYDSMALLPGASSTDPQAVATEAIRGHLQYLVCHFTIAVHYTNTIQGTYPFFPFHAITLQDYGMGLAVAVAAVADASAPVDWTYVKSRICKPLVMMCVLYIFINFFPGLSWWAQNTWAPGWFYVMIILYRIVRVIIYRIGLVVPYFTPGLIGLVVAGLYVIRGSGLIPWIDVSLRTRVLEWDGWCSRTGLHPFFLVQNYLCTMPHVDAYLFELAPLYLLSDSLLTAELTASWLPAKNGHNRIRKQSAILLAWCLSSATFVCTFGFPHSMSQHHSALLLKVGECSWPLLPMRLVGSKLGNARKYWRHKICCALFKSEAMSGSSAMLISRYFHLEVSAILLACCLSGALATFAIRDCGCIRWSARRLWLLVAIAIASIPQFIDMETILLAPVPNTTWLSPLTWMCMCRASLLGLKFALVAACVSIVPTTHTIFSVGGLSPVLAYMGHLIPFGFCANQLKFVLAAASESTWPVVLTTVAWASSIAAMTLTMQIPIPRAIAAACGYSVAPSTSTRKGSHGGLAMIFSWVAATVRAPPVAGAAVTVVLFALALTKVTWLFPDVRRMQAAMTGQPLSAPFTLDRMQALGRNCNLEPKPSSSSSTTTNRTQAEEQPPAPGLHVGFLVVNGNEFKSLNKALASLMLPNPRWPVLANCHVLHWDHIKNWQNSTASRWCNRIQLSKRCTKTQRFHLSLAATAQHHNKSINPADKVRLWLPLLYRCQLPMSSLILLAPEMEVISSVNVSRLWENFGTFEPQQVIGLPDKGPTLSRLDSLQLDPKVQLHQLGRMAVPPQSTALATNSDVSYDGLIQECAKGGCTGWKGRGVRADDAFFTYVCRNRPQLCHRFPSPLEAPRAG